MDRMVTLFFCETQNSEDEYTAITLLYLQAGSQCCWITDNAAIFGRKKTRDKTPIMLLIECPDH